MIQVNFIQEPEINPKDGAPSATLDDINGKLEFSDVVFSYPSRPGVIVLHGLDLVIYPGQTVALVGPSGSGKTTVLHLLMRLYNHSGGMVCNRLKFIYICQIIFFQNRLLLMVWISKSSMLDGYEVR